MAKKNAKRTSRSSAARAAAYRKPSATTSTSTSANQTPWAFLVVVVLLIVAIGVVGILFWRGNTTNTQTLAAAAAPALPAVPPVVAPTAVPPVVAPTAAPKPDAPKPAAVPPVVVPAPAAPKTTNGTRVPYIGWTEWVLDNVVIEDAVHVRPTKPFEAPISVDAEKTYQLKTDYDDSDPSTWKGGSRLYKFHVSKGYLAIVVGQQGDTSTKLCMGSEKDYNILWLKTLEGNGTSAFVVFAKSTENPPDGKLCP